MKFAYNPTSALLNELKNKKMSDREIMEAKGLGSRRSIHNPNLHKHLQEGWKYSDTKVKKQELPDARKHQIISFIKSAVRILGYGACWWSLDIGLTLLILAEVIGIGEELV